MIADCETCDRKQVPCSSCQTSQRAICFICQGDVADPYGELLECLDASDICRADNLSSVTAATTPVKRGRPTITAPRPWDSEGMSRRTWYRRRKEAKREAGK